MAKTETKKTAKKAVKKVAKAKEKKNIMEVVKTFEDACKVLKITTALPDVSQLPKDEKDSVIAYYKLCVISKALNEGWKPNWNNWDEYKYYVWNQVKASNDKPSGFGFSGSAYACTGTDTTVGSRLCFKTSKLAMYAGKQFVELYMDYLLMKD